MLKKIHVVIVLSLLAVVAPRIVRGTVLCSSRIQGTLAIAVVGDAPADPVIEEPIRPLTNPGIVDPAGTVGRCGAVSGALLLGGMAALIPLQMLCRRWRF